MGVAMSGTDTRSMAKTHELKDHNVAASRV